MLIKYYTPSNNKTFNNDNLSTDNKSVIKTWNNLSYPTQPLSIFDNLPTNEILSLIDKQQKVVKTEADILLKYNQLSKSAYDKTIEQYNNFFYYDRHFYYIPQIKDYISKQNKEYNTIIEEPSEHKQPKQIVTISREAIRNLTGYSPYFTPSKWEGPRTYVERQEHLIEDENTLILVLGSRQIGKCKIATDRVKLADGSYKLAKDITKNDILLGSNYQPISINQLVKNFKQPCYKITYDNGHEEIFSSEHRIPLDKDFNPKYNWGNKFITIKELFNLYNKDNKLNYKVPFIFNTKEQQNEDYSYEEALLYGYFLGNGCNNTNNITGNHPRLLGLKGFTIKQLKDKNTNRYSIFGYKQKVDLQGLSKDKFIDQKIFKQKKYLQWAVLDGLLNTDGYLHVQNNGTAHIEYCSISKRLIDDIFLLGLELGLIFKKRKKKINSNFKTDNEYAYYIDIQDITSLKNIIYNTNLEDKKNYLIFKSAILNQLNNTNKCSRIGTIPLSAKEYITNSSRKNKKPGYNFQREKIENGIFNGIDEYLKYSWYSIKNIEYVGEQEVVSIGVNSKDELFFGGGSLTHNSYSLSEKAIEESHIPNNDILVGAFTTASTNTIRNYLRRLTKKFPEGYWEENKAERYIQNMKTGSKIYFRTLADDAVDAIRGMTLNTILVDEAQLVSEYAYLDVLEPTLATTGGKMILIGTPPKVPDGYFVEQIFKYKRGELEDTSFYEIKLQDQPFTHPKVRAKKIEQINDPRVQRERFCNLTTDVDTLFKFNKSTSFPEITRAYYVLGIDPARKRDRSGYSVYQIQNGKAVSIESGFIPDTFKKDWKLQAIFLKKIKEKYNKFSIDDNVITVMDSSGVGDGVVNIFQEAGLKVNYTIRYTSGMTKTLKGTDYTVAKSVLINNTLDMISENLVELIDITNKDLLEEIKFIYETESRSGLIGFTSKFYDDVLNSTMIALFIIQEKNLISRSLAKEPIHKPSSGNRIVDAIEGLGPRRKISNIW